MAMNDVDLEQARRSHESFLRRVDEGFYRERAITTDVQLRHHDAWGKVALNVTEQYGEDKGLAEVFLTADELDDLAEAARALAQRLRGEVPDKL